MFTVIQSSSVFGVEGHQISVEVDIASGLPQVNVVGLADLAVRESVERVRSALKNSGFTFPLDRITVNLAPADLRKEGTAFDLAIAAGILAASGQIPSTMLADTLLLGELSLNGRVRPVHGVLAMLEQAKHSGLKRVLLPADNLAEAAWISGMELFGLQHLEELKPQAGSVTTDWDTLRYDPVSQNSTAASDRARPDRTEEIGDYLDVVGQHQAKRAMLIAAAGRHNVLLSGPPGTGKTMMIRRLPTILPSLNEQEALEVTKIYSIAGKLPEHAQGLLSVPPFRAPHHTISTGGLIGGGSIPKPGEITLAHHGVLYLDELPEFPRSILELLRQPLEDRIITIARAKAVVQFPVNLMLAASFNPCPCGYHGHEYGEKLCTCSPAMISRYLAKLSGPLLDRIDLQLEVPRPIELEQRTEEKGISSNQMRQLVQAARDRQLERMCSTGVRSNSELAGTSLKKAVSLKKEAANLLEHAFQAFGISMRAYDRMLKLARTIADLENCDSVEAEHVAEALQYRRIQTRQI